MADNVRQKVFERLGDVLGGITVAAGYQTQPKYCSGWYEAKEAQETCTLWIAVGDETFGEMGLSGRQEVAVEYLIYGRVSASHADLQAESNALLQDVRNAIASERVAIHAELGVVCVGFDQCDSDEGQLAHEGIMYWTQAVVFKYVAGDTW